MKNIDFRPEWYLESLRERSNAAGHVAGLVVLSVLILAWSVDSISQTRAAQSQLRMLQSSYNAQEVAVARYDSLVSEAANNRLQLQILEDVSGGVTTAEIIAEMSRLMPSSMNVREMFFSKRPRVQPKVEEEELPPGSHLAAQKKEPEEPDPTRLELAGWAASGAEIGSMVRRMGASPLFNEVTLSYEKPHSIFGRNVVEFQITCTMPEFE